MRKLCGIAVASVAMVVLVDALGYKIAIAAYALVIGGLLMSGAPMSTKSTGDTK